MAKAGKQLIRELVVNVKTKNVKGSIKEVEKLTNVLEDSAVGAELLAGALDTIPEALKRINAEAQETSKYLSSIGDATQSGGLDRMEDQLDEVIIALYEMQDTMKLAFGSSMDSADANTHGLIGTLERLEDAVIGVDNSTKKVGKTVGEQLPDSLKKARTALNRTESRGNNTTRMFSDMSKIAGPLPAMYALIAANVYTLSAAFKFLSEGAQLNRLEEVGHIMGAQIGVPIQSVAKDLQEATNYAISYGDALKQASAASTYGFSSDQIAEMGLVARRASVVLGVEMTDAMNRVTRGVSKLEIELLDELGITIRLTEAYSEYAKTVGKTAQELNGYQKQQAYLSAVTKQSAQNQGMIDKALQTNGWEELSVAVAEAGQTLQQVLAQSLEPYARWLASNLKDSDMEKKSKQLRDLAKTAREATKDAGNLRGTTGSFLEIYDEVVAGKKELMRLDAEAAKKQAEYAAKSGFSEEEDSIKNSLGLYLGAASGKLRDVMEERRELAEAIKESESELVTLAQSLGIEIGENTEKQRDNRDILSNYATVMQNTLVDMKDQTTTLAGQASEHDKLKTAAEEVLSAYEATKAIGGKVTLETKKAADQALRLSSAMRDSANYARQLPTRIAQINYEGLISGQSDYNTQLEISNAELAAMTKDAKMYAEAGNLEDQEAVHALINTHMEERKILQRQATIGANELVGLQREQALAERSINSAALKGAGQHASTLADLKEQLSIRREQLALADTTGVTIEEQLSLMGAIAGIQQQIVGEQQALSEIAWDTRLAQFELAEAEKQYSRAVSGTVGELSEQEAQLESQRATTTFLLANAKQRQTSEAEILQLRTEQVQQDLRALELQKERKKEAQAMWEATNNPQGAGANSPTSTTSAAFEVELARKKLDLIKETEPANALAIVQAERALELAKEEAETVKYLSDNYRQMAVLKKLGFEDTSQMNEEDAAAAKFEQGMALYDSAFGKLSAMSPALGAVMQDFQGLSAAIMTMGDTFEGKMQAVGAGIQMVSSMMAMASQNATAEIDKQIAAEKKRDGKSEESKKKIAQLEAQKQKKEKQAAKQQIIMNTAQAVMMALATLPPPMSFIMAGTSAAMGAMMLAQASGSSSISTPEEPSIGKLELGKRDNSVDLARGANAGELGFLRGERGIGSSGNFAPRARGGSVSPNSGIAIGEHGAEFVSNSVMGKNAKVISTQDSAKNSQPVIQLSMNIDALDASSIIDRSEQIFEAVQTAANARGFNLGR